jgi:hypothetical protein
MRMAHSPETGRLPLHYRSNTHTLGMKLGKILGQGTRFKLGRVVGQFGNVL